MAMKRVKIAELKDNLSRHLRAVDAGDAFLITDRDRPVALLGPVPGEEDLDITPATRAFATVRGRRYKRTRSRFDSLSLLSAERGSR
jgi:antitoxin (DNA-binding transcriptional repressor) of toxin-antitoxin stability system